MTAVACAVALCLASLACADATAQEYTVVNENAFSLALPGKWKGAYDSKSKSWQYRSADGRESVTVGILDRSTGADPRAIKTDFDAYLKARRKAELARGGSKVRLTAPQIQQREAAVLARYTGFDSRNDRRTLTRIVVNEVAAGSFYYEARGFTKEKFDARAQQVLGKVGLIGR
jgi:hypothetical protein